MLEETILHLLILSLYGNIAFAIISIVLLVIIMIIIIKNNHSSASQ